MDGSNNTNKLSPQEPIVHRVNNSSSSNNTNKLSPQEPIHLDKIVVDGSNNTNKLSPQEHWLKEKGYYPVQIIQINLVLKNSPIPQFFIVDVQIIQINLVLKNYSRWVRN